MDKSGSEMDNNIHITPEDLLPIVNKCFERISAAQWTMIAADTWDSETQANLTDMLTEIVQSLSTDILRNVLPTCQQLLKTEPQADITTLLNNFIICIGDSIHGSFAAAFHVPQDKCENAEKLAALVETEVAQKVHFAVAVAMDSPVWPSEPAVFVNGSMSNTAALRLMVFHAKKCLRRYLGKLNSQCLGLCWPKKSTEPQKSSESTTEMEMEEPEKCESSQSVKSRISVPSATIAVSEILDKWSGETPEIEEEAETALPPLSTSLDAHFAASKIVNTIITDLHDKDYGHVPECTEKSSSSGPHFDIRLILNEVKDFFASKATPSEDTANDSQNVRCKFFKTQFEKMQAELKSVYTTKDTGFVVSLKPDSGFSQNKIVQDWHSDEDILPGVILESTTPTHEAGRLTSRQRLISVRKQSSSVDYETIKNDVDSLFNQLNLRQKPTAKGSKTPDVFASNGVFRKFSKALTDKMYDHLMTGPTYQIPMVETERCLSDSVISGIRRKSHLSPEVLYVITEDAVGKFLQQGLLWLEKDPSEKASHSDKVSGALSDIQNLIAKMLTQPTEENDKQESPKASDSQRQTTTPSRSSQASNAKDVTLSEYMCSDDDINNLDVRCHVDSYKLIPRNVAPRVATNELSSECSSASDPSQTTERLTDLFITALIMRLLTKVPWKTRMSLQLADIDAIIKRLSEKAQKEINIPDSAVRKNRNILENAHKKMFIDLQKEFGSPKRLLEAAMASNDTSFDDAVLKSLKTNLNILLGPRPKTFAAVKSAVVKFFTAVGNRLSKSCRGFPGCGPKQS